MLGPTAVEIVDVGPRDGLQNATPILSPAVRAEFGRRLLAAGVPRVELISFVSATRVPPMAGAEEVIAELSEAERARCCGLVVNERGYDRLVASGLRHARFTFGVSDAFNHRNAGVSATEGAAAARRVIERSVEDGGTVGVVLATSFGCPYAGEVDVDAVVAHAEALAAAGADEVVFADTIGVAVPRQVRELFRRTDGLPARRGIHLHNTRNTGYANAFAAIQHGAAVIDASLGGLGGCPFAPRASGNIATEDLVWMLEREGLATGVDLPALVAASDWLASYGFDLSAQVPNAAPTGEPPKG